MTRRTRWRRAGSLAALVVGGLAVAGCQSVDAPSPSASPSVTESSDQPTPSPTASPSDPGIPTAAREHSEEGAEAFVRFFFTRVNAAWTTPQPGAVAPHSVPECQFCKAIESRAEALDRAGQRYATAPVGVGRLTEKDGAPDGEVFFEMALTQHRVDVVDVEGGVVDGDEERKGVFNVGVRWVGHGWRFVDMEKLT